MNAIMWWGAAIVSCIIMFKAWQNLIATRRLSTKRAVYAPLFWFSLALAVPVATFMLVPAAGPWIWLLVALATNGLLMMGLDSLLSRH